MKSSWNYSALKTMLQNEDLPCMIVDLDILDKNIERIAAIAGAKDKTIRVATKSVRVPELIRHILDKGGKRFKGLMCYCVSEAKLLSEQGFDDLLVAYPTVQTSDLEKACRLTESGKKIILMIDSPAHVEAIAAVWKKLGAKHPAQVCIDVDASYRPFGLVHLGVRRSPIRTNDQLLGLIQILKKTNMRIVGLMAYEAQIAGLADSNPTAPLLNGIKKLIKFLSIRDIAKRRSQMVGVLSKEGIHLEFFNGGGSGSVAASSEEKCLSEVAAGSGFLQSQLFDYYKDNVNEPAFCFALRVMRSSDQSMVTCQSGGFIASGESGADKAPTPFLPEGLKIIGSEGFGEVQTPLKVPAGLDLKVGDPVFARPAKAGEIAERFNEYLLIRGAKIASRPKTYRGMGYTFY